VAFIYFSNEMLMLERVVFFYGLFPSSFSLTNIPIEISTFTGLDSVR